MNTCRRSLLVAAIVGFGVVTAGRPASAQVSFSHGCSGANPQPNEVFVYRDANFTGPCAALFMGFYPHGSNLGIGGDQMSSLKVGSAVRARLFLDDTYGRSFLPLTPGSYNSMPAGWNDQVSSARIESASRSMACDDLQTDEFALFWDINFGRDCVVLHVATGVWPTPDDMGIMNDSVSSILIGPPDPSLPKNERIFIELDRDNSNGGTHVDFGQPSSIASLSSFNFNDQTSSVQIITQVQSF